MSKLAWFLQRLKDPQWVDRPQEQIPDEMEESVIPGQEKPEPMTEAPLNLGADNVPGIMGEGMQPQEEPVGEENAENSMLTPFSKKLRYLSTMKQKQKNILGGGSEQPMLGGGYGG